MRPHNSDARRSAADKQANHPFFDEEATIALCLPRICRLDKEALQKAAVFSFGLNRIAA